MSRVPWSFRRAALLPAGAALAALAALAGAANASTAHPMSASAAAAPSLSVYQTYGVQQGAVRGPGGPGGSGLQVWVISMMPPEFQGNPTGSEALDEVNPANGKVNYWAPLPPYVGSRTTLLAYDDGPPAFDIDANAWMVATATTFGGASSRYLVRYTPGPSTSRFFKAPAACTTPHDITSGLGDGSVWLACNSAKAVRITASGAMRTVSLAHVSTIGSLAAGAGGTMWAIGYNSKHSPVGLIRMTSTGGVSYYATPKGITARGVTGDGKGRVVETASCGSSVCFELVSSAGKLSHIGTAPGKVSASFGPTMDINGNVWLLMRGTASKTGQYFLRLSSGSKITTYAFSVADCGGAQLSIAGSPAATTDGSVWAESVTNCTSVGNTETAYIGGVIRLKA